MVWAVPCFVGLDQDFAACAVDAQGGAGPRQNRCPDAIAELIESAGQGFFQEVYCLREAHGSRLSDLEHDDVFDMGAGGTGQDRRTGWNLVVARLGEARLHPVQE